MSNLLPKHSALLAASLCMSLTACAVDDELDLDGDGDNEEFILLATVELDNGNSVEFYETAPGSIAVSETGPVDNQFSFSDSQLVDFDPLDLYSQVAGAQAEPPVELLEAAERRHALADRTADDLEDGFGTAQKALSSSVSYGSCAQAQQIAFWGPNTGGSIGHHRSSGTDRMYDKHYYRFILCVYPNQYGSVSMDAHTRRWWSWKKRGYWVTYPGYFRYWAHTDSSWDFDAKTRYWNGNSIKIDTLVNCSPNGSYNCWN